jgi:hypothetical protein
MLVTRTSTSELAAVEARLSDTSRSLTLEAGALVSDSKPADHPTVVLIVLCVAQFISALDVFIVNVALPKIGVGVGTLSLSDCHSTFRARGKRGRDRRGSPLVAPRASRRRRSGDRSVSRIDDRGS